MEARPLDEHDPLTRDILQRVGECIRKRARGEDVDEPLRRECKRIKTSPLDEGAGEGTHRSSNKELHRADASTTIHLKQSCRRHGSHAHIRRFKRLWGPRGQAVINYEFQHWKRILQTNPKRKWKDVQRSPSAVLKRVYREDDVAKLDWSNVLAREATPRPVVPDATENQEQCEFEYMRAQMEPGQHYSCQTSREVPTASGGTEHVTETTYFQLLGYSYSKHRPHLMPSVTSADNIALTAPMVMEILPHAVHHRDADSVQIPPASVELFPEADSKWIVPYHIAPFHDFLKFLLVWKSTTDSTVEGCEVWSDSERPLIKHGVLDDKCPTLAIIYHLKGKGWIPEKALQDHTTPQIGRFDCVEATKFKNYFQVLAVLERCLPLTSHIPSRQCMAFYRCLLRGLRVEPGDTAKSYTLVINADKRRRGQMTELLPLEDIPVQRGAVDPDAIILYGPEQPPPDPEPKRRATVATGRRRPKPKALPAPPSPLQPIAGGPAGDPPTHGGGEGGVGGGVVCPVGGPDGIVFGSAGPVDPDAIVFGSVEAKAAPRAPPRTMAGRRTAVSLVGTSVVFQPYVTTAGGGYPNFIMTCSRHAPPCKKTCGNIASNMRLCGPIQPLAFLHAWDGYDDPKGKKHSLANPPDDLVLDVAARHGPELAAMLDSLGVQH